VITVTQKSVIGVSILDGAVLWRFPWTGTAGGTMPIVYGETVIVSGLDLGVVAFTPTLRDGAWSVDRRWETTGVSMYLSNPVVVGDTIFGFSHRQRGQYFALDARSGATLWLGEPRQATNSAIVKAGHVLFFLNDDAELLVATSNRSHFELMRRYTVAQSATWAQPAISGNRMFIRDVSTLSVFTVP
jgi:outer membrane protein assembly factor BamB